MNTATIRSSLFVLLLFAASPALAQVGIVGRVEGEAGTGWTPEVEASLLTAVDLRAGDPAAAAETLAELAAAFPGNARVRYELALAHEAAYDRETNDARAAALKAKALEAFAAAAEAADEPGEEPWADQAEARAAELTDHSALGRLVRAKGKMLEKGDRGPAVIELQEILGIRADGVFGAGTEAALRIWQQGRSLGVDGVVGPNTLTELEEPLARYRVLNSSFTSWRNGRELRRIRVVRIEGHLVAVDTARIYLRMRVHAAAAGVKLELTSGFRSYDHQAQLYQLYLEGRGNLAARPGYSRHQDGSALDVSTRDLAVRNWLNANAGDYGFVRTVASEPWHWVLQD